MKELYMPENSQITRMANQDMKLSEMIMEQN
jgi:hypothetical protein